MKDGDKQLVGAAAGVVADETVNVAAMALADGIASAIPGLNIAWGLSKALYGNGLKLRQQRALEWVEMVRDNPEVFTEEMLRTETFQDGFVYCVEQYVAERNEEKRQYIKNIFLGYTRAGSQEEFPLERLTAVLQQLSNKDIATLKDVDVSQTGSNYQIYGSTDTNIDNVFNLIHLGLLTQDITPRYAQEGYNAPFVNISSFGKEFIEYVTT